MKTNHIVSAYINAALWSSTDENDNPLDSIYSINDISPKTLKIMQMDCEEFIKKAWNLIVEADISPSTVGYDFWLTRNGHGAGFWDRGLGDIGEKLTTICKEFSPVDLYVGEDGLIYS